MHLDVACAQRCRDFESDEAGADHHCTSCLRGRGDERAAVGPAAQIVHMGHPGTVYAEPHGFGTGGQQQRTVVLTAAVLELHLALRGVDGNDARVQLQVDAVLAVELGRTQRDPVFGRRASEIALGQVGSIAGQRVVRTEQRDRAFVVFAPQHLGRGIACRAATDDDDRFRMRCRTWCARRWCRGRLDPVADKDLAGALFNAPADQRAQRRCARRLAGAQVE